MSDRPLEYDPVQDIEQIIEARLSCTWSTHFGEQTHRIRVGEDPYRFSVLVLDAPTLFAQIIVCSFQGPTPFLSRDRMDRRSAVATP